MATTTSEQKAAIAYTRKAFAPPTARQLEQQAQAKARGGLTSRGIKKFESKSSSEQKAILDKERSKVSLVYEESLGEAVKVDVVSVGRAREQTDFFSKQSQFKARQEAVSQYNKGAGLFQKVSVQPTDSKGRPVSQEGADVGLMKSGKSRTSLRPSLQSGIRPTSTGIFSSNIGASEDFKGIFGGGMISEAPNLTGIAGLRQRVERATPNESQEQFFKNFAGGVAIRGLDFAQFGKNLFTQPKETFSAVKQGISSAFTKAVITKQGFPEIGQSLRQRPSKAVGGIGFDIAVGGLAGKVLKPIVQPRVTLARSVLKQSFKQTPPIIDIKGLTTFKEFKAKVPTLRIIEKPGLKLTTKGSPSQLIERLQKVPVDISRIQEPGLRGIITPTKQVLTQDVKKLGLNFKVQTTTKGGMANIDVLFRGKTLTKKPFTSAIDPTTFKFKEIKDISSTKQTIRTPDFLGEEKFKVRGTESLKDILKEQAKQQQGFIKLTSRESLKATVERPELQSLTTGVELTEFGIQPISSTTLTKPRLQFSKGITKPAKEKLTKTPDGVLQTEPSLIVSKQKGYLDIDLKVLTGKTIKQKKFKISNIKPVNIYKPKVIKPFITEKSKVLPTVKLNKDIFPPTPGQRAVKVTKRKKSPEPYLGSGKPNYPTVTQETYQQTVSIKELKPISISRKVPILDVSKQIKLKDITFSQTRPIKFKTKTNLMLGFGSRLSGRTQTSFNQSQRSNLGQINKIIGKQTPIQRSIQRPIQLSKQRSNQRQIQRTIQRQIQTPIQRQIQRQTPIQTLRNPPFNVIPSFTNIKILPPPIVPLPGFSFGLRTAKKRKKKKKPILKTRSKYRASLVAITKNIRGKKPRRLTGLGIRPIL